MQKDAIAIQDQVPLEVVQESEPIRLQPNCALQCCRSGLLVGNKTVEQAAAARRGWSAVSDHPHAKPTKLIAACHSTETQGDKVTWKIARRPAHAMHSDQHQLLLS